MKNIITCMAILSTTTALAGFSVEGKLEQGLNLAKAVQTLAAGNKSLIDQAQVELTDLELRVKTSDSKNPKLLKSLADCSATLKKQNDSAVEGWNEYDVQVLADDGMKKYAELKADVARYIEVEACKSCDAEVRTITLDKYAYRISLELIQLKNLTEKGFEKNKRVDYQVSTQICNFDGYFSYNDSEKFTKLKNWSSGGYNTLLSPLEVLNPQMSKTLGFIADKAPIKVNRTASKFGTASSQYTKGQINMKITYDDLLITGIDNVRHPEVANPILVINRDR
ncbi:hypothetical protein SHI21_18925 [Bacteriovorax sp. PP10]|uniref:Uncharacterized protein n=1 Tax=Bacteriovorax antarcticus TaxID=3088717 RepID=A0ABU5VZ24_9BACT|nr:hypothetical protein [Bacteriovorax sp. PP10]MEA9358316.1 hypothetical protein [Bacteriovorax sp. PP10]